MEPGYVGPVWYVEPGRPPEWRTQSTTYRGSNWEFADERDAWRRVAHNASTAQYRLPREIAWWRAHIPRCVDVHGDSPMNETDRLRAALRLCAVVVRRMGPAAECSYVESGCYLGEGPCDACSADFDAAILALRATAPDFAPDEAWFDADESAIRDRALAIVRDAGLDAAPVDVSPFAIGAASIPAGLPFRCMCCDRMTGPDLAPMEGYPLCAECGERCVTTRTEAYLLRVEICRALDPPA